MIFSLLGFWAVGPGALPFGGIPPAMSPFNTTPHRRYAFISACRRQSASCVTQNLNGAKGDGLVIKYDLVVTDFFQTVATGIVDFLRNRISV